MMKYMSVIMDGLFRDADGIAVKKRHSASTRRLNCDSCKKYFGGGSRTAVKIKLL